MVGRRQPKRAVVEELPVDLAARIGAIAPRPEPPLTVAEPPRRVDGPIGSSTPRLVRPVPPPEASAPRATPTDARGRPLLIGAEEAPPPPRPLLPPTPAPAGRPVMIGVEEAISARVQAKAAAVAADESLVAEPFEGLGSSDLDEISLVATPLPTPDDWHHFELALRKVRGVGAVRTEYYRSGVLKLRLRWSGAVRFASAIVDLPGYRVGILGQDRSTVQVRVVRA